MNIIIVTTPSNHFAGVFWKSYRNSAGPSPKAVFFLAERKDLNYSLLKKIFVPFFLFGIGGALRLISARYFKMPLLKKDRKLGLHLNYKLLKKGDCKFYNYRSINDESALNTLQNLNPDIIISIGAPIIFKKEVLQIPKLGVLNIHNALIPKYRGHFGTFWEVYHNEKRGYICIHQMAEKVDAGEIIDFDYLENINSFKFLDLMIEKKYRGGYLLAKILRETEKMGILFKNNIPIEEKDNIKNYFGWPLFEDILKFRKIARTKK